MRTTLVLTILATACTAPVMTTSDPGNGGGGDDVGGGGPDAASDSTPCETIADPFAANVLEAGISYLASDELGGRASGTDGDRATRAYIEHAFRCIGLQPGGDGGGYQQAFVAPDGTAASNVVGFVPGSEPGEAIIIGAHHDHLGTKAGQIYNGANDNASGTIALIAQARALAAAHPKRTIGFIAFGYEEHDGNCEGSEYFAKHPPAELAMTKVKYMVDMDMVGTYALANELTVYGTTTGTKGRTIMNGLAASYAGITFTHSGNAETDDSDFQAFADRGVPYVYFETWDEACYHKPCDDANRIDYANMSKIAKLGHDVALALANATL